MPRRPKEFNIVCRAAIFIFALRCNLIYFFSCKAVMCDIHFPDVYLNHNAPRCIFSYFAEKYIYYYTRMFFFTKNKLFFRTKCFIYKLIKSSQAPQNQFKTLQNVFKLSGCALWRGLFTRYFIPAPFFFTAFPLKYDWKEDWQALEFSGTMPLEGEYQVKHLALLVR